MKKRIYCALLFLVPALHAMKDPGIESLFSKEKHLKAIQPVQDFKNDFVNNPAKFNDIKKGFAAFLNKIPMYSMVENAVTAYIIARGNNVETLNNLSPRQTIEYVWFALAAWYGLVIEQEKEYMVFRMPNLTERSKYGISLKKEIMSFPEAIPTLPDYIKVQIEYERVANTNKEAKAMTSPDGYERSMIKSVFDSTQKKYDELVIKLVGFYEIYLMPALKDPTNMLVDIFAVLSEYQGKFPQSVFAVKCSVDQMSVKENGLPRCIVQVGFGKQNAKEMLDIIFFAVGGKYKAAGSVKYALQVDDTLVFFAQGNREFKGAQYAKYYDEKQIYYKNDLSGKILDFHLNPPVKNKKSS